MAAYEFPLWVAASFSTVAEVRKALKDVVIVAKAPSEGYGVAQLHWLVGDGKESIVIECQADGMHVYDDGLDVLTNQPPFPWHTENVRNYMHIETAHPEPVAWTRDTLRAFGSGAGMIGFPGGYDPASRFVRAAFLNAHYPAEEGEVANVTRLFRTLEGASMCKGGAQMADGRFEYTMFSDGYSAATKTYYWCTYDEPGAPERVLGRLRPERAPSSSAWRPSAAAARACRADGADGAALDRSGAPARINRQPLKGATGFDMVSSKRGARPWSPRHAKQGYRQVNWQKHF